MSLVPPGTIEQPHGIVNIKIGKKSVNPPEISLANRMQYIRDAVRDPTELKKFENMYARLRHMTDFARLFPLTKHPRWERVCHERNATIAKLRFFSENNYFSHEQQSN